MWIGPARPSLPSVVVEFRVRAAVLAVVEHDLKMPVGRQEDRVGWPVRRLMAVGNSFQIAIRTYNAIALVGKVWDVDTIFGFVFEDDHVATIVEAVVQQPTKDSLWRRRIPDL